MRPAGRFNLVFGQDQRVGEWVQRLIPEACFAGPYRAIGLERHGALCAGVVYTDAGLANISAHVAGQHFTRAFLKAGFVYPFVQLKLRRVTAYVAAKNIRSRAFCGRLGFVFESRMIHALPDDDVIVLRMERHNCRWING